MARTNIAAFQQFWFNLESAQLGFAGTAKWDAYWGKYDAGTQAYWMIGPPEEGWPLFPAYHAMLAASRPRSAAGRCSAWRRGRTTTGS